MHIIKIILAVLVAVVGLVLVIALVLPNDYEVKRTVVINRPAAEIYDYVKYLKNQDEFSRWAEMDPDMKKTYTGTDATVGFIARWESGNENVGVGEQEITAIDDRTIHYELRFGDPPAYTSNSYLEVQPIDEESSEVAWAITGHTPYPMNILNFNMDKWIAPDRQIGLDNLKNKLKAQG